MTNKEETNENLDLSGEYGSKSEFSKAGQVGTQIKVCQDKRSCEMKEGYFNYDRFGNKIPIPDSRKAFVSSVVALRILLKPEIERDKTAQEKLKAIEEKRKAAIETYGVYQTEVHGEMIKTRTDLPKYIPNVGDKFPIAMLIRNKCGQVIAVNIKFVPGMHDMKHHAYWNYMVELSDELFDELSELIDRNNYFDEGVNY